MRKIYIASSWKNAKEVRTLATVLEVEGHQVYDFTDESKHFSFNLNDLPKLRDYDYISFLANIPESFKAFDADKGGLDWADTVIMLQPSGRSSHLELGYAVGQGKESFIYGDLPQGEYECMYHFVDGCFCKDDLQLLLRVLWE